MANILVVVPTVVENDYRYNLFYDLTCQQHVTDVVIVDNGGNLDTNKFRIRKGNILQVHQPGYNANWLKSCNIGARIAKKRNMDFVCFLNDDVELSSNFFDSLLKAYNEEVGVIGPSYTGLLNPEIRDLTPKRNWIATAEDIELKFIDGTCMLIPIKIIDKIGLLDENYKPPGWGADLDYCYRVRQEGYKVIATKRAKLWHSDYIGGLSAKRVYGSKKDWIASGKRQLNEDMNKKYGPQWRQIVGYQN